MHGSKFGSVDLTETVMPFHEQISTYTVGAGFYPECAICLEAYKLEYVCV